MSGGFRNVREYGDAFIDGKVHTCTFRKVPSQATVAGWWVDLSMAAGNPKPNFYAAEPLVAAQLDDFAGIFHGDAKDPARKVLSDLALCTPTAGLVGQYKLLDYLLYYPFVDLDSTDEQTMDNTVTLPRYATGEGVEAMLVCVAPTTGSGTFTYNYIDSDGNPQTSPTVSCSIASAGISSLVTSQPATADGGRIFLPQASGSKGIRSITSVTGIVPNGGLAALVLVKPLASAVIREVSVTSEISYLSMRFPGPPQIVDGAYLNLVMNCASSVAAGTLTGFARFVWN
jgi:hypothetical protein